MVVGILFAIVLWVPTRGVLVVEDVHALNKAASEYQIKAAILYNLVRFIDWPDEAFADSRAPVVISIVGKDPFGSEIEVIRGQTVQGRKVVIHRARTLGDLRRCHVLFVSESEKGRLVKVLRAAENWNTLTVADWQGSAEQGACVDFYEEDHKIRFSINIEASSKARLKVSSKLLRLAQIVESSERRLEER